MVELVHVEAAIGLSFRHALRHDPRRGAMCNREAVGNEEDDVPCNGRVRRVVDFPRHRLRLISGPSDNGIGSGFGDTDAIDTDGRRLDAFLLLDEPGILAKHFCRRAAVDGQFDFTFRNHIVEFDLQVKGGRDEDGGAVDRIDGRGMGQGHAEQGCGRREQGQNSAHRRFSLNDVNDAAVAALGNKAVTGR